MGQVAETIVARINRPKACAMARHLAGLDQREDLDDDDRRALREAAVDKGYPARALRQVFVKVGIGVGCDTILAHRGHGDCTVWS